MINCIKWQHQKRKSVSEAYNESESELQIIKEASKNKQTDVFNIYTAKNEIDNEIHLYMMLTTNLLILFCV